MHPLQDEFLALFEKHARHGASCDHGELDIQLRLATSVMRVLENRAGNMVMENRERPLLYAYSSDGWSTFIMERLAEDTMGATVNRRGRSRTEFLLERGIQRARSPGGEAQIVIFAGPPRSLRHGRGSWNMYTASRNFRKTLREEGHRGTSITIYNFDGALVDSTVRKLKAFHHL